ncbi:MAG TPA: helix-turn-helix domain-containing protein [Brevibacterium ravenspurgense]|nr:helix-turn-helix domain-containing protein [Brevibacterium ravenspurgense]
MGGLQSADAEVLAEMLKAVGGYVAGDSEAENSWRPSSLGDCGLDGTLRDEVEAELARLRSQIDNLKRRNRELLAIHDATKTITSVRTTDEILDEIVGFVHSLGMSDVTYLSQYYPEHGYLKVRASKGAVSREFSELEVLPDTGMATLVVNSQAAKVSTNYFQDNRFVRSENLDTAVAAEGLVSLAGVPLIAHSRVVGVLFLSSRSKRRYSPEEIATISSFADIASATIWKSLAFTDMEANAEVALKRLAHWENYFASWRKSSDKLSQLFENVVRGSTLSELLAQASVEFAAELMLIDAQGETLASSPGFQIEEEAFSLNDLLPLEDRVCQRLRDSPPLACVPIRSKIYGRFFLLIEYPGLAVEALQSDVAVRLAELCLGAFSLHHAHLIQAHNRREAALTRHLLNRHGAQPFKFLEDAGFDPSGRIVLIVSREPVSTVESFVRDDRKLIAASIRGTTAAVVAAARGDEIQKQQAGSVPGPVIAWTCETARDFYEKAPRQWPKLESWLQALTQGEWPSKVYRAEAIEPVSWLLMTTREARDEFMRLHLGPLLDAEVFPYRASGRSTPLLDAVTAYCEEGRNMRAAADRLFIHVNTLSQRFSRLDDLLGDWRQPDRLFAIEIAVRFWRLTRDLQE